MSLSHGVTQADVSRIYAEHLALGRTAVEAHQGTRTKIHELIHLQLPTPYSDAPSHIQAAANGPVGLSEEQKEALRQHQFAQVTEADMLASEKARMGPDGTHRDAHHFVQKQHQKSIWEETDRLVNAALGGAS